VAFHCSTPTSYRFCYDDRAARDGMNRLPDGLSISRLPFIHAQPCRGGATI